jgi:hypothetical protein
MRRSAISTTLSLALLAALCSPATGDDVWLADFEPPAQWAFVGDHSASPTTPSENLAADLPPPTQLPTEQGYVCNDTRCDSEAKPTYYVEAEVMALRAHFGETAVGKLAEKYEASERIIVGVENVWGAGARIRYWSYDRTTPILTGSGDSIRFNFDVVDFEGTTRFITDRFDLLIAGGVRWADIKIDIDSGRSRNDMPGGTIAADLRAMMCYECEHAIEWHSVTGARISIFGGDWEGSPTGLITPTRDDNITVVEIYGGFECARECHGHVLYARLLFEAQNWRSDALGADTGIDSLGFIGPGASLGFIY